jgi:hypothetical protein
MGNQCSECFGAKNLDSDIKQAGVKSHDTKNIQETTAVKKDPDNVKSLGAENSFRDLNNTLHMKENIAKEKEVIPAKVNEVKRIASEGGAETINSEMFGTCVELKESAHKDPGLQ